MPADDVPGVEHLLRDWNRPGQHPHLQVSGREQAGPGTPISCADAADCPGEVCCGDNLNGLYSRVSCAASCMGMTTGGATEITFCDPAGNDCPAGTTCQPSQVLAGYNVCN